MTAPDPTRDFPELEMQSSLDSFGGWLGWLGQGTEPCPATAALQWKAGQGDELPDELLILRNAFAQFGYAPIEEAVARVQGLEKAFAEIDKLTGEGVYGVNGDRIREIVRMCVKFSGAFDPVDDGEEEEKADDA